MILHRQSQHAGVLLHRKAKIRTRCSLIFHTIIYDLPQHKFDPLSIGDDGYFRILLLDFKVTFNQLFLMFQKYLVNQLVQMTFFHQIILLGRIRTYIIQDLLYILGDLRYLRAVTSDIYLFIIIH